jgi:peptidoglycan/LPS O-acetylase OafA/YrhL
VKTRIAIILGCLAIAASAVLLLLDAKPELFPGGAHDYLATFALGVIAAAWLLWQSARGMSRGEFLKTALLVAAFLFWAMNQFWSNSAYATFFNDLAVGLFVLDVLLAMLQWPRTRPEDRDLLDS